MESHGNKSNVGNDAVGGESASAAPLSAYGPAIAQSAVQGIGMSTKDPCSPGGTRPKYAKAVSILFSNATSQKIMVDKHPQDVASTTHLWMYLKHDNRFRQVPMSEAAPGDVIVEAHVRDANGYAGIVVDHGRVVANSNQGVRINSSLVDHRRSYPPMAAFRYMGVPGPHRNPLANAGFNEDEARLPAGQSGGGEWTDGGTVEKESSTTRYPERFLRIMEFILKWEGGYDNDPDDPGGETKYGIDKRSHPTVDIKSLTTEEAMKIYWRDYWLKYHCDQYPRPRGEVLFNTYINGGPGLVQKILRKLGKNWTADEFLDELEAFYRRHAAAVPGQKKYLSGWLNRTEDLRRLVHSAANSA